MSVYENFYRRSIDDREAFWAEQTKLINWHISPKQILDYSKPPFAQWFVGGSSNLCYNAVDRHLDHRAHQNALIFVSTETGQERVYTYSELHSEVQRMAAILLELGVQQGDRVMIYMPMIAQACFAMLACVRIGAIHSVVFGGFASHSLAARIDDAAPKLIISADAGSRGGKVLPYKLLLDEAIGIANRKPSAVLMVDRGLSPYVRVEGRDHDYAGLRDKHQNANVPCTWVDSTHPSYTLYTSGTTGKPKGVQRDTGGHAVALVASMKYIFNAQPGETFFSTSDIGWVVGHSYIIYGPLLNGMATIMYEGTPTHPDAGVWWRLVEKYRVTVMFTAPTAVRLFKKHDPSDLNGHDLSSLRALFLAGEPLDTHTAQWISKVLQGKPIIDNYWQTETGWPILALCNGIEPARSKFGSPGKAVYGYDIKLLDDLTGTEITIADTKGVLAIEGPLPPGCLQTVWGDDARFVKTYWSSVPGKMVYCTFDWAMQDQDGYFYILGRTDDVINVAGHRLGTREIEESISSHPNVAEVAVVGVADSLKGQVAVAFVIAKDSSTLADNTAACSKFEGDIMQLVNHQLGAVARPSRVYFVTALPKTRSGKLLRRAIQAVCENRDPGDLSTIEDARTLQQIKELMS